MAFCVSTIVNLSRHLKVSHGVESRDDRFNIIRRFKRGDWEQPVPVKHSFQRSSSGRVPQKCYVCDKVMKRLDSHLTFAHGLKRGSLEFRRILHLVSKTSSVCNFDFQQYGCHYQGLAYHNNGSSSLFSPSPLLTRRAAKTKQALRFLSWRPQRSRSLDSFNSTKNTCSTIPRCAQLQ